MINEADHVESIGHDLGFGEVFAYDGAVDAGQVHTDDTDALLARQSLQIRRQSGFTAPQHHIENCVMPEVAEGGGISILPGKEMFVDTEHPRANLTAPLGQFPLQKILEPALHSGAADFLPPPQAAAVHPVVMRHEHAAPERFSGALTRKNAGKPLPKRAPAILAPEFARFQLEHTMAQTPALMTRLPPASVFHP